MILLLLCSPEVDCYGFAVSFSFAGGLGFFVVPPPMSSSVSESAALNGYSRTDSWDRLAAATQGDVHAAIAGQNDRSHIIEHPLPLFRAQLGIPFNRIFHLGVGQVLLFAERLGLDVGGGNALFDQETLDAVDTPFGELLIVFHGTARVGMAFKSQAGIRLALEICLEISGERTESFLLAGKQAGIGILGALAWPLQSKHCGGQASSRWR